MSEEVQAQRGQILAFRAGPEMLARVDEVAAREGLSRADVARRALLRDLARANGNGHG